MKKIKDSFRVASILFGITSCATLPEMTAQEKRAMQVKTYDSNYENTFRSLKNVLQDEGYMIKQQDMNGGLVTAIKKKSNSTPSTSGMRMGAFGLGFGSSEKQGRYPTAESYEASVNLEKINKDTTETRINIQFIRSFSDGNDDTQEVLDPVQFQSIYQKLGIEIERRKAQGRS